MAKIVLIDDEKSILELLQYYLQDIGHESLPFADAKAAIEYIKANSVDLVITDMRMPGMSGLDICRWIKSSGKDIKLVTMSGFSDVEEELDRMDVQYRLKKPFALQDMGSLVESCLSSRDLAS